MRIIEIPPSRFKRSRWDWLMGIGLLLGILVSAVLIAVAFQMLGLT